MFEWLVDEMSKIKTNKFHLVDGPLSPEKRELVETTEIPVPPSYKQFVIQFGNAKLYRKGRNYLVQVYAVPQDAQSKKGEALLNIGRANMGLVYFKESLLVSGSESPVFEWQHRQGVRQTADGFETWLKSKCQSAKRGFTKKKWSLIEQGPPPFTDQEQMIVEARRKFRWHLVGVAPNGDIQYEVYNGSDIVLPYLSIGIRGKNGKINGGVFLPVSSVMPGQTKVIEKESYKKWLSPDDVEAFEKPDPGPEDRDLYWEFKNLT